MEATKEFCETSSKRIKKMASEIFSAREGSVNPINAAGNGRTSAYQRKLEKERAQIADKMANANPQFGLPSTYHQSPLYNRQERDSGRVDLPDGARIEINELSSEGNQKYYWVRYFDSKGNQGRPPGGYPYKEPRNGQFNSEKRAVNAQKKLYEAQVARLRKKYNL